MKAEIYMKTNQDPYEYVEHYKNLVNSFPTVENMIELANAYLKIQVNIIQVFPLFRLYNIFINIINDSA